MRERRPNILFIVDDDCGYADLGCTGQTDFQTG
jgi:arylsulfatase A-like enzyme